MTFTLAVIVANIKILFFTYRNSVLSIFIIFGSILVYFVTWLIFNAILDNEQYGVMTMSFETVLFPFGGVIILFGTNFFDFGLTRNYYLTKSEEQDDGVLESTQEGLSPTLQTPLVKRII